MTRARIKKFIERLRAWGYQPDEIEKLLEIEKQKTGGGVKDD